MIMKHSSKITLTAFIAGMVFAAGLSIGGMTNPSYIQGFLNMGALFDSRLGHWYPRLAFVMIGAVLVMFFVFRNTGQKKRISKPLLDPDFRLPKKTDIDRKLILGAILFGIGWGLYGYCPGPALANLLVGGRRVLLFVVCMLIGMLVAKKYTTKKALK